jgi:hypothetical protein
MMLEDLSFKVKMKITVRKYTGAVLIKWFLTSVVEDLLEFEGYAKF